MTVTFSIVIPTYNRADLLPRAIDSALAQSFTDFEVLVVDDGSTDGTPTVMHAVTDSRVQDLRQPNAGVSAARNAGALAAAGEFLLFLDSDDELRPDALEQFLEATRVNQWRVVLSGWTRVSSDGVRRTPLQPERSGEHPWLIGPFLPGAFVIDRSVFAATGGYDEHLRFSENTVLGWRTREVLAASGAGIGMIREALVTRYSRPERPFDPARYEAALRILDHYADTLANPLTGSGSPRKRRASYLAVAGRNAAALGLSREAWRYSFAALRSNPLAWSRYGGLFGVARILLTSSRGRRA